MVACGCTIMADESGKLNLNIFLLIFNNDYVAVSEINALIHRKTIWKKIKYKSFWKKLFKRQMTS